MFQEKNRRLSLENLAGKNDVFSGVFFRLAVFVRWFYGFCYKNSVRRRISATWN